MRWLADQSFFRLVAKSRQIGFSTIIGGEALHKQLHRERYDCNVISVNQREAASKVTIARNLYYSIPEVLRKPGGFYPERPWNDSAYELSFHAPPHTSTLVSQPASAAIRGGQKDIYFDEAAHIRDMRKLYQAALPAITRGDSRLSIGSSPLGESGLFWEIATKVHDYPEYSRHVVPWWECSQFVKAGRYAEALAEAPKMTDPRGRVVRFGTDKMIAVMRGFGPDTMGFVTEYEAAFVDESDAYFPWELLVNSTNHDLVVWERIPDNWSPQGFATIGVDLAKKHDKTVFSVWDHFEDPNDRDREIIRQVYLKSLSGPYDAQFEELKELAKRVDARRVSIDETGPGTMFVEKARRADGIPNAEGIVFTNSKKERWATTFKGDLQRQRIELLPHREFHQQVHDIERTKTESNFYRFEGRGHDDMFWSAMLGIYGKGRRKFAITVL